MAFLLVDSISAIEPGKSARGSFAVPAGAASLPICLVAEAVGQLAAWAAMAECGFARRPVAGLADEVSVLSTPGPGDVVALAAGIESIDGDAVAYNGFASAGSRAILGLRGCVGPMLPMEQFDDPAAVAARLEALRRSGSRTAPAAAQPGFAGIPADLCPLVRYPSGDLRTLRAEMHVARASALYADHFPRQPVLPGTLLLDAQIRLALELASARFDAAVRPSIAPVRIREVKLRSFIRPGQVVQLEARLESAEHNSARVALSARCDGRRIASAFVELAAREST